MKTLHKTRNHRQDLGSKVKKGKAVTKCHDIVYVLHQEWEDVYLNHALKQFTVKDSPHSYEVWLSANKSAYYLGM